MTKRRMGDLKATSQLQIERIGRANIADVSAGLCALDWSVRARRVPPDFWPWLYFRNPAGDAVAIAAFDGHRPVGRFERIPVRVAIDGQTQTADLMQGLTLAPEFRQWTHLRRLLAAALRAESAVKPVFSFGFTTSAAARLNASLGHPVLGRVPVFAAVLDGAAMLRGRKFPSPVSAIAGPLSGALFGWRTRPHGGRIEVSETSEFTGNLDELRPSPATPTAIYIRKDSVYLNWRYVERPGACYRRLIALQDGQPAGFLVWRA
ncbi:MAG: GNAT family N-acetyltransferase, partial [Bryobacteraceae bacterium]